ncbi:glyoxylate reductase/hydroxypyruvate reductase-like [Bombyx mandarina]|uniref:Glyoxylate reductase/hydroxypyruvate reductase n=1 Tax=Bombyx mandarina TaxID=7092 RepID=A0A6J2JI93_BOMMA|nr:glyoxylate reductase/hydroxypyruvate reductase-like [Bombyx mandarina]
MSPKRVLIVNGSYPVAGLDIFKKNNVETEVFPHMDYEQDFMEILKQNLNGYDGLIWNTKHRLTAEILDLAGPQLKAISAMASGIDNFDLDELKKRGIPLGNTPNVLNNAVADIAVGLLISAARKFKEGVSMIERNEWKFGVQWILGQDIAGSTVGIIGLGGIGQAVVRRLKGFDVSRFLYCGRSDKPEAKLLGVERVPLQELLEESDFVVLVCPLTNETRHLINADTLKMMKKNAVLVNIARGEIIDHVALYEALKNEQIFAAGLDVVSPEPIPADHPLLTLPNCYIIPHLGSATIETRNKMAVNAAKNIILAFEGKSMLYPTY